MSMFAFVVDKVDWICTRARVMSVRHSRKWKQGRGMGVLGQLEASVRGVLYRP